MRAQLEPLEPGERPRAVTVGAIVTLIVGAANLIAYIAGQKIGGQRPAALAEREGGDDDRDRGREHQRGHRAQHQRARRLVLHLAGKLGAMAQDGEHPLADRGAVLGPGIAAGAEPVRLH